ncbi:hypothetical protein BDZ89DRAFT_1128629 [Hymenopellis radicata]|nr:hypothetical protein BDZ89DRAFT_1128629 [Hymenopellis radicata]
MSKLKAIDLYGVADSLTYGKGACRRTPSAESFAILHSREREGGTLERTHYKTVQQYQDDWKLMFDNARAYNQERSTVYNDAEEMEKLKKTTYKANEKMTYYNPVSYPADMRAESAGDPGRTAAIEQMQAATPHWMKDPAQMLPVKRRSSRRARKKERAAADARTRSAKIKLEANEAFRKGDYKEAFILYSVCCQLSGHEPLYFVNRAAAGLRLNIFAQVLADASHPFEMDFNTILLIEMDFSLPKAFFRRAQAYRFLGDFDAAEADITEALSISEYDPTLVKEMEELKRLQALDTEGQEAWLSQQESKTVDEVFGSGEVEKLVEARLARQD